MLHIETVDARTLSILERLMVIPELESFYLVGGTALALKNGHRISIDLDLFGGKDQFDRDIIIESLENEFGNTFFFDGSNNKWGIFCFIDGVKVDIIRYLHPVIQIPKLPILLGYIVLKISAQ